MATDLLSAALPAALLAEIDLTTLTVVTSDHLVDGLEVLQSDCVCRCRIRSETGYLFIGAEHQSSDDELMAFRTLLVDYKAIPSVATHRFSNHPPLI